MNIDISQWVEAEDKSTREFRQAIHTFLLAISNSKELRTKMIMKGAILLAIEFHGNRYTKDIDFSTSEKAAEANIDRILAELSQGLVIAVDSLPYDLNCKIQSWEMRPSAKEATFPTLQIKIGYAYKGSKKHERLIQQKCPTVLAVDYSFNESNVEIDTLELTSGIQVKAYSLADLVAEKFRAILQQSERDRFRRQDPYDIYCLKKEGFLENNDLRPRILESLILKSLSRNIEAKQSSMRDKEIIRRARREYPTLADEIKEELPPFEEVYETAREYYETLPWE